MAYSTNTLDSSRWLAVSRRDGAANSTFFYGAISTRIFCRPTCPGRLARRSNVVFFDNQDQAIHTGYRPCKRCQPCNDDWSRGNEGRVLAQCLRDRIVIAQTEGTSWTVEAFARELGISGAHLHRQFKRHYHLTPKSFGASFSRSRPSSSTPKHISDGNKKLIKEVPVAIIQSAETQLGDLLVLDPVDDNPEWCWAEQEDGQATSESFSLDHFGIEHHSMNSPSFEFFDIPQLEEMFDCDRPDE